MYRPAESNGDSIPVPQIVFSRLGFPDTDEARVRVALYVLSCGECDVQQVANGLHIKPEAAAKALSYWEGAGLLEQTGAPEEMPEVNVTPRRRHMNTAQVNLAAQNDAVLGAMMRELQHIFGGVVNQKENNIYSTLYCEDHFPADLILMAAIHCVAEGKCGASRVERMLLAWRKEGIDSCEEADKYLRRVEQRQKRYEAMAVLFGQEKPLFTAAERRMIDSWFEEYGYEEDMVEAARLAAGEKENEVRYLNGILKKWKAKGYATAADMRRGEEGSNLSIQGSKKQVAPEQDLLQNTYFNPIKRKGGRA